MAAAKGFLGPIGDDLPSLIPLLFALMMFFYVFTFTWNIFDEKGRAFDDALATLRVGNTLKGNNYISGFSSFEERCNETKALKRVKFMAGLLPLSTGPGQSPPDISLEGLGTNFFCADDYKYMCTNTEIEYKCNGNVLNQEEGPTHTSQELLLRSFPVALEFQDEANDIFYVRPMLLVVVTWR